MIRKGLTYCLSTTAANLSPNLPYPFEYTFKPDEFKHRDARFQVFPAVQKLSPGQKQHIDYVFTLFQQLFNKNTSTKPTAQYIDPKLIHKISLFKQVLKDLQLSLDLKINPQTCTQSLGYVEYYGYKPDLFIHEYSVNRLDDKLMLVQKEDLNRIIKTGEEQLQQDIKDIEKEGSIGDKIKSKLFKDQSSKSKFALGIAEMFTKSFERAQQDRKFKNYILVNSMKSTVDFKVNSGQSKDEATRHLPNVQLISKWYYEVTSEQPQSVRKNRKRVLFDFQLWNRGTFVPIKDFSQL